MTGGDPPGSDEPNGPNDHRTKVRWHVVFAALVVVAVMVLLAGLLVDAAGS